MKLWQKPSAPDQKVETFTVGRDKEFDLLLAAHDLNGTRAQAGVLAAAGLLSEEEHEKILRVLQDVQHSLDLGVFVIEDNVEDVHSQIELLLTRALGDVGKKIHAGRSRNDQVLTAIKLFIRDELKKTGVQVEALFELLLRKSEEHKAVLLPGYTHLQAAMPSSFGLWFGAYAESLSDDLELLIAAYNVADRNPLGSAAGYGSSFPLDRELGTQLMNFGGTNVNAVYAQMTRGKTEKFAAVALAALGATLARLGMDVCLYMGQNFNFISFPDALTTGSSIMPHKKNPDVFELIRARGNRLQSLPNELSLLTTNLPSGYHRDLQLTKEILFPAFRELNDCLEMAAFMLQHISVKDDLLEDERYNYLFSVETVNRQVLEGIPFREAYRNVGMAIEAGVFRPEKNLAHTHLGSIGNLGTEKIREDFQKRLAALK